MNRVLLRAYLKTFACTLLVSLALVSPLILFAPAPYSRGMLTTFALIGPLPPVLWSIANYSRVRLPTGPSIIPPVLAGLSAVAALYVTHDVQPEWTYPTAALIVIAVLASLAVRWRWAVRKPSFFPAGRLA